MSSFINQADRNHYRDYIFYFLIELLKDKDSINRQLEDELTNSRKELELTKQRLRQIEDDQHAQLSQSESTTNYLERRIHELDRVRNIPFAFFFF